MATGLVFTTYRTYRQGKGLNAKVGAGLHPRHVLHALARIMKAANNTQPGQTPLPSIRFHDLRHSAASLLIASGVELAVQVRPPAPEFFPPIDSRASHV